MGAWGTDQPQRLGALAPVSGLRVPPPPRRPACPGSTPACRPWRGQLWGSEPCTVLTQHPGPADTTAEVESQLRGLEGLIV